MSEKYKNKYRIKSARHPNWDYRWSAAYFITINTSGNRHYFGEISDGEMQLNEIGVLADTLWCEIKNHFRNVELGEFVVMPNHIHGILILIDDAINASDIETGHDDSVETLHATSLPKQHPKNEFMSSMSPKKGSVSAIIRSYKSAVTKHAHRLGYEFAWQTRFHDHIIRGANSYKRIADYIIHNPRNWDSDKYIQKL